MVREEPGEDRTGLHSHPEDVHSEHREDGGGGKDFVWTDVHGDFTPVEERTGRFSLHPLSSACFMEQAGVAGDSQSVNPGAVAVAALQKQGVIVRRVSNVGMGPYDYVRMPTLWKQYKDLMSRLGPKDLGILIFGSNDAPDQHLLDALKKMKAAVKPKIILTGPPQYPDPTHQVLGAKIRDVYMKAFGPDYFDSYPYTDVTLPRAGDKLHFTYEGAKPWGEAIAAEALRRLRGA